jgi:hypothetical protein
MPSVKANRFMDQATLDDRYYTLILLSCPSQHAANQRPDRFTPASNESSKKIPSETWRFEKLGGHNEMVGRWAKHPQDALLPGSYVLLKKIGDLPKFAVIGKYT